MRLEVRDKPVAGVFQFAAHLALDGVALTGNDNRIVALAEHVILNAFADKCLTAHKPAHGLFV